MAAAAAALLGVDPLLILFAAGCIVVLRRWLMRPTTPHIPLLGFFFGAAAPASAASGVAAIGVGSLFLYFLKVGAVLFGSGYLLLAFLRADLVERWRSEERRVGKECRSRWSPYH